MRKGCAVVLVLAGLVCAVFSTCAYAEAKLQEKSIVVTTMDIEGSYEVIDIVSYRSTYTNMSDFVQGIKTAAKNLKADAVIGLRFVNYADYFYAYGTAVRVKK